MRLKVENELGGAIGKFVKTVMVLTWNSDCLFLPLSLAELPGYQPCRNKVSDVRLRAYIKVQNQKDKAPAYFPRQLWNMKGKIQKAIKKQRIEEVRGYN